MQQPQAATINQTSIKVLREHEVNYKDQIEFI